MIIKKILSLTVSIINLFIFLIILTFNSNAQENNVKYFSNDEGVLSIMYHRFNEFKYPSTNISMDIFKEHVDLILDANLTFYHPKDFINEFDIPKKETDPKTDKVSIATNERPATIAGLAEGSIILKKDFCFENPMFLPNSIKF